MEPVVPASRGPIIVGVDGSPPSDQAVVWAALEARSTGLPLHLVHADSFPRDPDEAGAARGAVTAMGDDVAVGLLERARQRAQHHAGNITVTAEVMAGRPSQVLIGLSEAASMVVTGRHGDDSGFPALPGRLGSVSAQVVTYARSRVVVVPADASVDGPIVDGPVVDGPGVVVGVDPGPSTQAAIGFALDYASRHAVLVTAVRAWNLLTDGPGIRPEYPTSADLESSQRQLLSEALAGWRDSYPDVTIRQHVVRQRASQALTQTAIGAELVVVAARGNGGFQRLLLGSIAEKVVRHATCPVAVIH